MARGAADWRVPCRFVEGERDVYVGHSTHKCAQTGGEKRDVEGRVCERESMRVAGNKGSRRAGEQGHRELARQVTGERDKKHTYGMGSGARGTRQGALDVRDRVAYATAPQLARRGRG